MFDRFTMLTIGYVGAFALLYLVHRSAVRMNDKRMKNGMKVALLGISIVYFIKVVWILVMSV